MHMSYTFNVENEIKNSVAYLKAYANKYVIGMSGGKDSLVTAKLATLAVGADNVTGLILPNGTQKDIQDAIDGCNAVGIKYYIVNIGKIYEDLENALDIETGTSRNKVSETNDPACIRTLAILAMTRRIGGVMLNTCNREEDVLGYSTFGGDSLGAVGPLTKYTVPEVLEMGDHLELPYRLVHKDPADNLCGTTDEINLSRILDIPGFTYARLAKLIRGEKHDFTEDEVNRIIALYNKMKFKIDIIRIKHHEVDLYDYFDEYEKADKDTQKLVNHYNLALNIPVQTLFAEVVDVPDCSAIIFDKKGYSHRVYVSEVNPFGKSFAEVLSNIETSTKHKITDIRYGDEDCDEEDWEIPVLDSLESGDTFSFILDNGGKWILEFLDPDDCK